MGGSENPVAVVMPNIQATDIETVCSVYERIPEYRVATPNANPAENPMYADVPKGSIINADMGVPSDESVLSSL